MITSYCTKQLKDRRSLYKTYFIYLLQDLEGFQEITNPKGTVLNSDNHEEVSMGTCFIFHCKLIK